jgi:predicted glycogen debranching enzyme
MEINRSILNDYYAAREYEWIETNGLGGYSNSTIICCNERRYHALLVAAVQPPAERLALVSKFDETIISGDDRFELGVNNYGDVIHPNGHQYLISFTKVLYPEFIYEVSGIRLKKTITMIHGENTVVVIYEVLSAGSNFILQLLPLFSVRNYHALVHANEQVNRGGAFEHDVFSLRPFKDSLTVYLKVPGARFTEGADWYYHFRYSKEEERGMEAAEDLFRCGEFQLPMKEGDRVCIVISTTDPVDTDGYSLFTNEVVRRRSLVTTQGKDDMVKRLTLAADQFIVERGDDFRSVIAGYPWFTDWSRDTMIALPGLCLCTERFDDAKKILSLFASSVSDGMLPNRFMDNGEPPEYNQVDGTLWYFVAVYRYLVATGDEAFVLNELLPVLKEIYQWHVKGTRFNIHEDDDGLLYAGEEGVQLTWMDAKVEDWVVTPRIGKPVEVNALWYNALCIYAELLKRNKNWQSSRRVREKTELTIRSFNRKFWNKKTASLFDVITDHHKDDSFRPNQIFAISLPFSLLTNYRSRSILKATKEKLYTPVGLKTLSADDVGYSAVYEGDRRNRDASYHQGIAWSWLLGPYVDAIMKVKGRKGVKEARQVIESFRYHLDEAGIGTVSEIFDAEAPNHPRGCVAQAWGVAEVLRVTRQYGLFK